MPPDLDAEPPRYANVRLTHPDGTPVDRLRPLPAAAVVALDLDIGALDPQSAVAAPTPFPDRLVPGDTWLRVLVISPDFAVAADLRRRGPDRRGGAAGRHVRLPGRGQPVRARLPAHAWSHLALAAAGAAGCA
ncbi:MAG TPA: hypothetical protein VIL48_08780 [Acidimicrobiales bacterium]